MNLLNLFETKIQYLNDDLKKASINFIVNAVTFGDAEDVTIKKSEPYIKNGYDILFVRRSNIREIFDFDTAEKWFKIKLLFISAGKNGKEKKTPHVILVRADSLKESRERVDQIMRDTIMDYQVAKIEETPILEVLNLDLDSE